jgi:Cof subfamily protein (haloacid dehalogenase superfamily)
MTVRAICSDIDGTLLNDQKQLSTRTISCIKKISKHIPVILASSRMPSAMRHLQHELGIPDHPLICYNGGNVMHFTSASAPPQIFVSISIPVKVCTSILSMAKETNIHVSLYNHDHWYAPRIDHWTDREQRITKVNALIEEPYSVLTRWEAANVGAHKVMCMGPEEEIHEMERELQEKHSHDIHIYRSRATYLELAPKSISKATGLQLILEKVYNFSLSDVMAFGDNYNDIDMLQSAGLGIAVANARDEVKAAAREITLSSIDDGVAVAIEKYLC